MKNLTIKNIISAVVLSTVAVSSFAAPANGPKPKCPIGQIPVIKNNMWVCAEPTIKAPGKTQESSRATTAFDKKVTPAKPERAKPDLQIANVIKLNDPTPNVDSFKVYVKNTEGVASNPSKLGIKSNSFSGEMSLPSIPANSGKWIQVKTFSFDRGDRILLEADSKHTVAETNENNNTYAFNW